MRTALDTNVLSSIWGGESAASRASAFLDEAGHRGGLVIVPIVYVELRAHPNLAEGFVDRFLQMMRVTVEWTVEQEVWLLAAERFEKYAHRRRGQIPGEVKRFPADFLVAAHALLRADRLATFDLRSYRADFPELQLVQP
jgi:predicted nucleic acid-binding protein